MSRARTILLGLLLAVRAATAQEVPLRSEIAVTLEPASITVGDPVTATLSIELPAAAARAARFPDWTRGWGEAEVLEAGAVERRPSPSGELLVQKLRLTAFRTGEIPLPPVSLRWDGREDAAAATPAGLRLEVRSVLPAEAEALAPLPAEPPRALPVPSAALWAIGLLAAAVLAAAWAARRSGGREAGSAAAADLAPLPELVAALAALPLEDLVAGHRALSVAVRRFLGRTLGFPAVESTTREIERQLASRRLDPTWIQRGVRLLREADQVKFARRGTSSEELERRGAEALALATAIEAHLRPPEPAAAGAA